MFTPTLPPLVATAPTPGAPVRLIAQGGALAPALMSDGRRFAAAQLDAGALLIVDAQADTQRAVPVPGVCPPAAMGFGQVVLACAPSLVSAATGRLRTIRGARASAPSGPGDEFDAIGRQWLQGTGPAPGATTGDVFVNWHTGSRRVTSRHRNVFDLSGPGPPNLDDARLRDSRRCSGQWIYARSGSRQVVAGLAGQLVLQRCGQPATTGRVLDTCDVGPCTSVQLTASYATWGVGAAAFSFSLRDGRTQVWRFPGFHPMDAGDAPEVVQAAGRFFFATTEAMASGSGLGTRLYEARP